MQIQKETKWSLTSLSYCAPFWKYGLIISLILHICILLILNAFTIVNPISTPPPDINSQWNSQTKTREKILVISPAPIIESQVKSSDKSASSASFHNLENSVTLFPEIKTKSPEPLDLSNSFTNQLENVLAQPVDVTTGLEETGTNEEGKGFGLPFFGIKATGKKVVYVVDSSRSMNHSHSKRFKTRFDRIKFELQQSINHLEPDREFFIIFFNNEAIPMPANNMQLATSETRRHYLHWANSIKAEKETDPRQALYQALRLKPDVIYFLTDGSIEKVRIVKDLRKIRQNQSAIHTIAFGNREAEPLLRKIASQNRGRFYFVP